MQFCVQLNRFHVKLMALSNEELFQLLSTLYLFDSIAEMAPGNVIYLS